MSRPWTSGPWVWQDDGERDNLMGKGEGWDACVFSYLTDMAIRPSSADCKLIVLAERMAEAILAYADCEINPLPYPLDEYAPEWMHELHDIADKLHRIIEEADA